MREFADIDRRIELLCSQAALQRDAAQRLAEIGDVLAQGYASALSADARCLRLADTLEELLREPDCADAARRVANQRRTLVEATRRLRARLALVRELYAKVSAGRRGVTAARQTSWARTA